MWDLIVLYQFLMIAYLFHFSDQYLVLSLVPRRLNPTVVSHARRKLGKLCYVPVFSVTPRTYTTSHKNLQHGGFTDAGKSGKNESMRFNEY